MTAITNSDAQRLMKQMTAGGNYDFSAIIGQIGSRATGASYNDIAWFANAIQNGNTGEIILSSIQTIGNIYSNLGTNDEAEAVKKNQNDNEKIKENKDKSNEIFNSLNESLNTILSSCNEKKEVIENALEVIEKLGGDKGMIAKKQEELQEKLAIIKAQQEILNNPNTKSDERRQAIRTILDCASCINAIAAEVDEYKSQLEEQQNAVKSASKEVNELTEEMESIKEEGSKNVEELTTENIELIYESTNKVAQGTQKEVLGGQQVATGTAMTSGPQAIVSGSTGAKLILSGKSKIAGGTLLMSGAADDFKNITTNVNSIQKGFETFTSYVQGIGEFNDGITKLVGAFDTTVEPMITSIGTWEGVKSTNQALKEYSTEYAQSIGMYEVQNDGTIDESKSDSNKDLNYQRYEFDMSAFDNVLNKKEA